MPKSAKILVIDDEPLLRQTLSVILQRAGYHVTPASSTREGKSALDQEIFDLVFLDLRMPEGNGLDFMPTIRASDPNLPVLILTAHATVESAIEAVRKGARDYLLKPVDPQLILTRVSDILCEVDVAKRRDEIVRGMQGLLKELDNIEGCQKESRSIDLFGMADPARYLQRGPIELDLLARQVSFSGRLVSLSPTAFDYLTTLVRHSPNAISCEVLVSESQGYESSLIESQEMARWRIHELRKALEPNPKKPIYLITVRGTGYRLVT